MKTASNGRFGTMAAVIPQTILWKIARLSPAGSSVKAATAPSRFDVVCKRRERCRKSVASRKETSSRKCSGKRVVEKGYGKTFNGTGNFPVEYSIRK